VALLDKKVSDKGGTRHKKKRRKVSGIFTPESTSHQQRPLLGGMKRRGTEKIKTSKPPETLQAGVPENYRIENGGLSWRVVFLKKRSYTGSREWDPERRRDTLASKLQGQPITEGLAVVARI